MQVYNIKTSKYSNKKTKNALGKAPNTTKHMVGNDNDAVDNDDANWTTVKHNKKAKGAHTTHTTTTSASHCTGFGFST